MDNTIQVRQLLDSMQSIRSKMPAFENKFDVVNGISDIKNSASVSSPFSSYLTDALGSVNDQQKTSNNLATAFERGDPGVDITQVMISMEKASISFQALTQVRNKMVDAYRDIMNMPV
jgi:flagellar hook-basal body complex protein FliE